MTTIQQKLFALTDPDPGQRETFRAFQAKIVVIDVDKIIGVRTPAMRKLAKVLEGSSDAEAFLQDLPHRYHEENMLHAYLIGQCGQYDKVIQRLERFLPYVDNWATCDSMNAKVLKKHTADLLPHVERWLASTRPYTVRFAIDQLMSFYLEPDTFRCEYPERVAALRSEEYYVNMMIAWYFATALAKQWDAVVPYIENRRLSPWCHRKAIQKAIESYRISPEQKTYLRTLK